MKIYLSLLSFLICFNSFQAFGVTGPATTYKITMKKIELCTAAPLANEHDTTCTGATVVGTGNTTFNISSVTAGSDVGNFVSTAGLPIGTTFTHAKPTMNREFTIKGYAEADSNCFCRTESDSTYGSVNKYYALQWGVCEANATDAANNAEDQTFYVYTDTASDGVICGNAACDTGNTTGQTIAKSTTSLNYQYGKAISDPAVTASEFDMIFQLESSYTVGLTAPRIEIAFGTDAAVNASEWTDGKCLIEAYFPRSTVTITE
jgi:hypothetical protein